MNGATRVSAWLATANVQFCAREPVSPDGILRVGDAGGYIHPLAGDGMAMAAREGELAAAILGAHLRGGLNCQNVAELLMSPFAAPLLRVFSGAPHLTRHLVRATRGVA